MAERVRVQCPFCNMHPFLEDLLEANLKDPKELHIFVLKFGGKVAGEQDPMKKKKKGGAKGYMEMVEVTDSLDAKSVQQIRDFFNDRVAKYTKGEDNVNS